MSQEDRDATLATIRLRLGYEISPALTPFVEGEIGRRFYDDEIDSAGYERSATWLAVRMASAIDIREKFYGEASIGWMREDLDDQRLGTISGLALAANLNWCPSAAPSSAFYTIIEGTTDAGKSGSILHSGALRMERQIRSNLTAEAFADISWRNYTSGEQDLILSGQYGLTWWLNRNLGLFEPARYERLRSDVSDRDYDAKSLFIGLRLQR